jgi:hypothetical protein
MGKLMFGKRETITCLADIPTKGPKGEALCVAYKTTGYFLAGGLYLHDDGHVLGVKNDAEHYIPLDEAQTAEMQHAGVLPTPLPGYSIPFMEYFLGYSLWWAIAVVAVWGAIEKKRRAKREADDAATPVSEGPPTIATKADQWLEAELGKLLGPGERVMHQAYTLDHDPSQVGGSAYWAALTTDRLVLIKARVGAFGPLLENQGVTPIPRAAIRAVRRDDRALFVEAGDRAAFLLFVIDTKKASNQRAFLRDVPRLCGAAAAPADGWGATSTAP